MDESQEGTAPYAKARSSSQHSPETSIEHDIPLVVGFKRRLRGLGAGLYPNSIGSPPIYPIGIS